MGEHTASADASDSDTTALALPASDRKAVNPDAAVAPPPSSGDRTASAGRKVPSKKASFTRLNAQPQATVSNPSAVTPILRQTLTPDASPAGASSQGNSRTSQNRSASAKLPGNPQQHSSSSFTVPSAKDAESAISQTFRPKSISQAATAAPHSLMGTTRQQPTRHALNSVSTAADQLTTTASQGSSSAANDWHGLLSGPTVPSIKLPSAGQRRSLGAQRLTISSSPTSSAGNSPSGVTAPTAPALTPGTPAAAPQPAPQAALGKNPSSRSSAKTEYATSQLQSGSQATAAGLRGSAASSSQASAADLRGNAAANRLVTESLPGSEAKRVAKQSAAEADDARQANALTGHASSSAEVASAPPTVTVIHSGKASGIPLASPGSAVLPTVNRPLQKRPSTAVPRKPPISSQSATLLSKEPPAPRSAQPPARGSVSNSIASASTGPSSSTSSASALASQAASALALASASAPAPQLKAEPTTSAPLAGGPKRLAVRSPADEAAALSPGADAVVGQSHPEGHTTAYAPKAGGVHAKSPRAAGAHAKLANESSSAYPAQPRKQLVTNVHSKPSSTATATPRLPAAVVSAAPATSTAASLAAPSTAAAPVTAMSGGHLPAPGLSVAAVLATPSADPAAPATQPQGPAVNPFATPQSLGHNDSSASQQPSQKSIPHAVTSTSDGVGGANLQSAFVPIPFGGSAATGTPFGSYLDDEEDVGDSFFDSIGTGINTCHVTLDPAA